MICVKCLQKFKYPYPPRPQDNSNALPLGQSNQSSPCPSLPPCQLDFDRFGKPSFTTNNYGHYINGGDVEEKINIL